MESFYSWTSDMPEMAYNPSSSKSVSSYFTRPSKVVKSGSRNPSPKVMERRRTVASGIPPSRTRSVVDHLRASTQQWQHSSSGYRSRPLSWHPNCFDNANVQVNSSPGHPTYQADLRYDFATTQVNGLITPLSYPVVNEPQIQEMMTPLDDHASHDMTYFYGDHGCTQMPARQTKLNLDQHSFDATYPPEQYYQSCWLPGGQISTANVPTAPTTPNLDSQSTVQSSTLSLDTTDLGEEKESEELVGMGLYDSPAEVQSSSLLFNNVSFAKRKALKLEESFVPMEKEDGEEDEEEEDEDAEIDDEDRWSDEEIAPDARGGGLENGMFTQVIEPEPEVETMADRYLATLKQMDRLNGTYFGVPSVTSGYSGYGWI